MASVVAVFITFWGNRNFAQMPCVKTVLGEGFTDARGLPFPALLALESSVERGLGPFFVCMEGESLLFMKCLCTIPCAEYLTCNVKARECKLSQSVTFILAATVCS